MKFCLIYILGLPLTFIVLITYKLNNNLLILYILLTKFIKFIKFNKNKLPLHLVLLKLLFYMMKQILFYSINMDLISFPGMINGPKI